MRRPQFDHARWIGRLATALETLAPTVTPWIPAPPDNTCLISFDEYCALADHAKHHLGSRDIFEKSHLSLDKDPKEAIAILREHPLIQPGLTDSAQDDALGMVLFTSWLRLSLKSLVLDLTKHAIKTDSSSAAELLHRYLTLGEAAKLPASEITVFHGLTLDRQIDLGNGAFLAPYEDVKTTYDLPDDPEDTKDWDFDTTHLRLPTEEKQDRPRPGTSPSVLVRELTWGPGVAPAASSDRFGTPRTVAYKVGFRFPGDYEIVRNEHVFPADYRILMKLLSIAARSALFSQTRFIHVAKWIQEIDPNFAFGIRHSGGFVSDTRPREHPLTDEDATSFATLSRDWINYRGKRDPLNLAVHRLAVSFSRPGGLFAMEDRILDTAIALEILYGLKGPELTHKLSIRAAWLLDRVAKSRKQTLADVHQFYRVRSSIVHGDRPKGGRDAVPAAFAAGRDIACLTLPSCCSAKNP